MPKNIQQTLYPYLYLFITDISQLPQVESFSNYESQEPGYARPFLEAYQYAFKQPKNIPLDPNLFKRVNAIATQHLPGTQHGEYRDDSGSFSIVSEVLVNESDKPQNFVPTYSLTENGIREFIEYWLLNKNTQNFLSISFGSKPEFPDKFGFYIGMLPNYEELAWVEFKPHRVRPTIIPFDMDKHFPIIQHVIRDYAYTITIDSMPSSKHPRIETERQMHVLTECYQKEITDARSKDEKIIAIARYIQHIEQLHPFMDGNIRTCYIMLNKLLKDHGLPLSILYNPNKMDCCDLDTVVKMIKEGQKIYLRMLNNEDPEALLLDASKTTWSYKVPHIRCEACHDIPEDLLADFARDVLTIPNMNTMRTGIFSNPKQTIVNQLILEILPLLVTNQSGRCPDIRASLEAFQFGIAFRRACAYGECAIADKILDIAEELEINLEECSSNGKNAIAWLKSLPRTSAGKEALITRLNCLLPNQNPSADNR